MTALTRGTMADLDIVHERALALGARVLQDRSDPLRVYADPAGHPFCIIAAIRGAAPPAG